MRGARTGRGLLSSVAMILAAQQALAQAEPSRVVTEATGLGPPLTASQAADHGRIVTVVAPAGHPTLPVLRAELEALGLAIREALPDDAPGQSEFAVILREGQIEVWVREPRTGGILQREVFTQADEGPVERLTSVLRAVELLRTRLHAPAPPPRPPNATPMPSPAPAEPRSVWVLAAVTQVLYSPGGTTAGLGVQADVGRYWSNVGLRGFAATALLPNRHVADEGVMKATPRFVGIQGAWLSGRHGSPLVANLGAGIALISTRLSASPKMSGYSANGDHLLTAAPIFDLRLRASMTSGVALVGAAALLVPLRSDRVLFGEREVARHGAVIVTGGPGIQVNLP